MRENWKVAVAGVVCAGLGMFGAADIGNAAKSRVVPGAVTVPQCEEDEYLLIGDGDFEHGRYEDYDCLHPDDFVSDYIENEYRNPAVYAAVRGSVCEHKRFWKRTVGIGPLVSETCDH